MYNAKKVLVVAPHPDDETLGCGGTLLKYKSMGFEINWLILTKMTLEAGYNLNQIASREREVLAVKDRYGMENLFQLDFPAAKLDQIATTTLIEDISKVIQKLKPEIVFLPFYGDAHSDHKVGFEAAIACCKSFRAEFIEKIFVYETLSETDFNLKNQEQFIPNVWFDIADYLENKLSIMSIYKTELAEFPFPRSIEGINAQAKIRGMQANTKAAEAFMLLKEIC
jgi:LmbE family N-acetylglucosaminyl deacetylase